MQATANIFANIFGLKPELNQSEVARIADSIKVDHFQPKNIAIKSEGEQTAEPVRAEEDEEVVQLLLRELASRELHQVGTWNLAEFEKDDPTNFHIEQVGSVSNLRARNYRIEEVDNFQVKLIAGKIIPAIATTTAMVVGAVGVEIIKNILKLNHSLHKNSFMNLALPLWLFSDPEPPVQHRDKLLDEELGAPVKAIPPSTSISNVDFTSWDKINVKGPITIAEFRRFFESSYKVTISMIEVGGKLVYNKFTKDSAERLSWDMAKAYEKVSGQSYPKLRKYMQVEVQGELIEGGVDVRMPTVKYEL